MITSQSTLSAHPHAAATRAGFTLVEMLIAMAITLLMMAAIGRGFAFVGERVKDSRANLQLSADASDITTRLRDELSRCTVDLTPNTGGPDQAGYFMYYEGPVTDATSSLFGAIEDPSDPSKTLIPNSRYGDFDDYLAFTAVAPPGSWFTGKVPRFILDRKTQELGGVTNPGLDPLEPVTIRSRYAEIVYFLSPEYDKNALPVAQPQYIDVDGRANFDSITVESANGFPDRMFLHRRVLLIRPDLNLSNGGLPIVQGFMRADDWPIAAAATLQVTGLESLGWLYGMTAIHQQCDLSVRRIWNDDGTPRNFGNDSTDPTIPNVAANSLADLSQPHNRFAHARVPSYALTGSGAVDTPTSMPVLALCDAATILSAVTENSSDRIAPPSGAAGVVVTPRDLCGFIRPEFTLGNDWVHFEKNPVGGFGGWAGDRQGEDIVTNNVLGFDLKIYDTASRVLTTENGSVVGPNDAGYREVLSDALTTTTPPTASQTRGEIAGGFVDLCYPVLAGGSVRGWQQRFLDRQNVANALSPGIPFPADDQLKYLRTPFSGVFDYSSPTIGPHLAYANSLYRSGKLLIVGGQIRIFQPTFDTYTSSYERDGFLQNRESPTDEGVVWRTTTLLADSGSDGLDGFGIYSPGLPAEQGEFGADDLGEHETLPPFITPAEAVQISVRLYNPSTRQIKQMSVIHRGKR